MDAHDHASDGSESSVVGFANAFETVVAGESDGFSRAEKWADVGSFQADVSLIGLAGSWC